MTVVMRDKGCTGSTIGFYLVVVGALNWGLIGIGNFLNINLDLVSLIFGGWPVLQNVVYIVIGVAAVMIFAGCRCKTCAACRVDAK